MTIVNKTIYHDHISTKDFSKISSFIYDKCGIKITVEKKVMLEGRLRKRVNYLGLPSFDEYIKYIFTPEGMSQEMVPLIDAVTTNKTDFFREPNHFDFLCSDVIPELQKKKNKIEIWSAGCSSGEEPYTLAIVMEEMACMDYSIYASDISTNVLQKAHDGIYEFEKILPVPDKLLKKYFLKSKNPEKNLVKVIPSLREKIELFRFNLIEDFAQLNERFDVIFCRNVIIYFDKQTQEKVIRNFCDKLNPGGFLFLGHSETINDNLFPLKRIISTVYKKI